MRLNDFQKHSYYGTGTMYCEYDTFQEFVDEMGDTDVDMNLCYRFDLMRDDDEKPSLLNVYTIQQRKGRIVEHHIKVVADDDIPLMEKYFKDHYLMSRSLFAPFFGEEHKTLEEIKAQ